MADFFTRVATGSTIARRLFGACEWNNRIVIAGGIDATGYLNDVWESVDGVNWNRLATGAQSFSAREGLVLLVHDRKLVVVGGWNGTDYMSDVWVSGDGTKWDRMMNNAYTARDDISAFSLNGRLFVVGGDASSSGVHFTDVWSSPNLTTWTRILNGYSRLRRTVAGYCTFNKRMHIICGYDGVTATRYNTATMSPDGMNWDITGSTCGLPSVDDVAACVFDNRIVVSGGYRTIVQTPIIGNSLYYSMDGEKYQIGVPAMGFSVYQHKLVALKEPQRLFSLFGYDGTAIRTDVWRSYGNWQDNNS